MSKTFRPWDVDQVWLLPPSVQDLVPAGRCRAQPSAIMAAHEEEGVIRLSPGHDAGAAPLCVEPGRQIRHAHRQDERTRRAPGQIKQARRGLSGAGLNSRANWQLLVSGRQAYLPRECPGLTCEP